MRWELVSRGTKTLYEYKLPAGKYYVGDPDEMLLTGVLATTKLLDNGIFHDLASDSFLINCKFEYDDFLLNDDANDIHIFTKSGVVAIMSENIVKPLPEFDSSSISFGQTFVVEVDLEYCTFTLMHEGRHVRMYPNDPNVEVEETDEQMYARLYAAIGVDY